MRVNLHVAWKPGARDVRPGLFVGCEGVVGGERKARLDDPRLRQEVLVFVEVNPVGDPGRRRARKHRFRLRQIQFASRAQRKYDVGQGIEWYANEQMKPLAVG